MGAKQQGADAIEGRWLVIPRTLCFVRNGNDVLLMKRSEHRRVFPNQFNGLGGHIESDEDARTAVIREVWEESGLEIQDVRLRAVHHINTNQATGIILFTFAAVSESRDVTSDSREGTLHWVPITEILDVDLVEDLPLILPRILSMPDAEPPLFLHVRYNADDQIQIHFAER